MLPKCFECDVNNLQNRKNNEYTHLISKRLCKSFANDLNHAVKIHSTNFNTKKN